MARALIVQILGDARQYGAELDKAAGKTRSLGKVAGVAGLAIAGGLAIGLEKSVVAAAHAQQETSRLDAAFKAAGLGSTDYAGAVSKAEDASRKLGFTNEDVRNSLGSLIIATHNTGSAIKDMGVAQDLARFKSIPLADATKMLTTAMAGSQRAAKQLGIIIPSLTDHYDKLKASGVDLTTHTGHLREAHAKLLDKMETGQAVIARTSELVKGQGKAFANTATGGLQVMHAQIGQVEESLGQALLPTLVAVTGKLAEFTGWLAQHTTVAKLAVAGLALLAAAMLALSVATSIATAAATAFDVAAGPIILVILALVAAIVIWAAVAYEVVKHWSSITTFFTGLWNDVKNIFDTGIDFVKTHWHDFVIALATIIAGPIGLLVSYIATHWDQIKTDAIQKWNEIKDAAGRIWGNVRDAITGPLDTARSVALNIWDGVKGAWTTAWNAIEGAAVGPIQSVITWIEKLIGWVKDVIHWLGKIHIPHIPGSGVLSHIPGLASGGIVTQPTLAMVGEAGPEAIVPLNRGSLPRHGLGGGGGGVMQVNLNVDGKTLARILIDPLRSEAKLLQRSTGRPAFS